MLEVVIQIAKLLSVPVVAEGVETEHQLDTLRHLGCDIIQGYFFSRPVPAKDFEAFILQKKEAMKNAVTEADRFASAKEALLEKQEAASLPLPPDEEKNGESGGPAGKTKVSSSALQLRHTNILFSVLGVLAAIALFVSDIAVTRGYERMEQASDRYIAAQLAAT